MISDGELFHYYFGFKKLGFASVHFRQPDNVSVFGHKRTVSSANKTKHVCDSGVRKAHIVGGDQLI